MAELQKLREEREAKLKVRQDTLRAEFLRKKQEEDAIVQAEIAVGLVSINPY